MEKIKAYKSDIDGKRAFVADVLSPLMRQACTGWYGAEYEYDGHRELVQLINAHGEKCKSVDVSADSIQALIVDVFNEL